MRTRVVVDVIAGTSAGGINGICLAKGARPRPLAGRLPRPLVQARRHRRPARRAGLPAAGAEGRLGRREGAQARAAPGRPDGAVDLGRLPQHGPGRAEPATLADADARPAPARAVRHRHGLLRLRPAGPVRRPEPDPRHAPPPRARVPLRRRRRPRRLRRPTRTARSPSPPGRPPASPASSRPSASTSSRKLARRSSGLDFGDLEQRFFRIYELAEFPPGWTWFVDGGVLDNKPFGPAIQAIRERPAECEVDRRLLYLEPDPGEAQTAVEAGRAGNGRRGDRRAHRSPAGGADPRRPRRGQRAERARPADRRHRRRRAGTTVESHVREIAGPLASIPDDPADPELAEIKKRLDEEARTSAGFSYATYVRLKISGVDRPLRRDGVRRLRPPAGLDARAARPELAPPLGGAEGALRAADRAVRRRSWTSSSPSTSATARGACASSIDGLNHLYRSAGDGRLPAARADRRGEGPPLGGGRHRCATRWPARSSTRRSTSQFQRCFDVDAMREFMQHERLRRRRLRRRARRGSRRARGGAASSS